MDQGDLTMTALAFILGIACLFFVLLAFETTVDSTQPKLRQFGLFTWLVSGNWPAKVGAGLLIIGIGALIRYFLLAVQLSPDIKIGSGIAGVARQGNGLDVVVPILSDIFQYQVRIFSYTSTIVFFGHLFKFIQQSKVFLGPLLQCNCRLGCSGR